MRGRLPRLPACVTLVAAQLPRAALACSGPGAEAAITLSDRIVFGSLLIGTLCFLCGLLVPPVRRRLTWKGVLGLGLALPLHPGLLLGTRGGDCGFTARWAALVFVVLVLGAFAILWRRSARTSR